MRYIHEKQSQTIVVEQAYKTLRETRRGSRQITVEPVLIQFSMNPKKTLIPVPEGIPFKGGMARGWVETENVVEKIKMSGLGFFDDETGEDVTQQAIDEFLAKHPRRDRDFIAVDLNGSWIPREDVSSSGAGFFCNVCQQHLTSEHALIQHEITPIHMRNELAAKDAQLAAMSKPTKKAKAQASL